MSYQQNARARARAHTHTASPILTSPLSNAAHGCPRHAIMDTTKKLHQLPNPNRKRETFRITFGNHK